MSYSVSAIIGDVRKALDENEVIDALIVTEVSTLGLDAIITQKITDAVRSVTESAPSHLLDSGIDLAQNVVWHSSTIGSGYGYVSLPDDFMRLVVFKMSDWARPVVEPISDTDPRYFLQKSRFPGIRGNTEKPVCAITTNASGKVMEFYSCTGGATVSLSVAKYIPYPKITNGTIDICAKLYIPSIYYCAGLVALTLKDQQQAQALFEIAKSYLNE